MFALKLIKIGASIGIILQSEMLAHLNAKEDKEVFAVECPTGYRITTLSPNAQKQIEAGTTFMDGCSDTFVGLADKKDKPLTRVS